MRDELKICCANPSLFCGSRCDTRFGFERLGGDAAEDRGLIKTFF